MSKSFILTNVLSTCICGECFSSWVIMNQTPELTAPTASQCFPICCLTSKCILTSLWDFFFSFTVFDERHLANWQWYPVHCNLYSALGVWAWNERAGYRLKGKKKPTKQHHHKARANQHVSSHFREKHGTLSINIKLKKKKKSEQSLMDEWAAKVFSQLALGWCRFMTAIRVPLQGDG